MADQADWECGWEDARRRAWTAGLAVTPAERLRWLEDMIRLAYAAGALPRREPPAASSRPVLPKPGQ